MRDQNGHTLGYCDDKRLAEWAKERGAKVPGLVIGGVLPGEIHWEVTRGETVISVGDIILVTGEDGFDFKTWDRGRRGPMNTTLAGYALRVFVVPEKHHGKAFGSLPGVYGPPGEQTRILRTGLRT